MKPHNPEELEQFFESVEATSRQLAAILGTDSNAAFAVSELDRKRDEGHDYVILFTPDQWIIGPRPSWNDVFWRSN